MKRLKTLFGSKSPQESRRSNPEVQQAAEAKRNRRKIRNLQTQTKTK